MEIDFSSLDYSRMFVNPAAIQPKQDLREVYKDVYRYEEYHQLLPELDIKKVLKYIAYVYDKNSPLHAVYNDIKKLKVASAQQSGFIKQDDGRFLSHVEEMLVCSNPIVNAMIIRYVITHKNALYSRYVIYSELHTNEMNKLLSGEKGSKVSDFDTLSDKLDEIRQQIFSQDNSIKLVEDFESFYFEDKLRLRPEDIALKIKLKEDIVPPPVKKKPENIDKKAISQYEDEDEEVVLNVDPDLIPIYIKLPKCEDKTQAQNYGLKPKDQKFRYVEMPKKLQNLVASVETADEIWQELENNQDVYKAEIQWIQEQWYYVLNGFWFYNNGKLTYIDGWHYGYLNFWRFGGGVVPEYRDRDRKWYHGVKYAYTTTEYPALDEFGRLIWLDKEAQRLEMVDAKRRVCLGYTDPKGRRAGDSNKHLFAQYLETIIKYGVISGIISSSGEHAQKKLFQEILVTGWQQMPFFMRPITSSNENPDRDVKFYAPRKKASVKLQDQLKSKMDYSTTSASSQYDGGKLYWLLGDEGGKTEETDVYERHQQLKECVSQGAGINIGGFIGMPSTVGEMLGSGGKAYFKLCNDSKFEKRTSSGQTLTGLILIYITSLEGMEGFVDEYGYSVIGTPTKEQAEFIGKSFGADEHVESKRAAFLADNNTDGYNEFVRLFPKYYRECFRTEDGDIGFNSKIINERLDELAVIEREFLRRGNFEWDGIPFRSNVKWQDDPNGRWRLTQLLHNTLTNRHTWTMINGKPQRAPLNPKHITCCDPYKQEKVTSGRMSDGGIATFYDFDPDVDQQDVDPQYWKSYRIVCTYLNRPGKTSEFYDDVFKQCLYFGSWLYPEVNIAAIIEYAEEREMMGFFLYDIDWKTGKYKSVPGFTSQGESKQALFNCVRDYIETHGHKEKHSDFLSQCKEIQSMDEMTDYDLFTAGAGAIKGAKSRMISYNKPQEKQKHNYGYKKRRY